ncbi:hypothetical protein HELRODRAFT_179358 [Helobdella robusta]|uniref:Cadherin domain-containing protein n=1 Tax=Helobdella robusta TaxID=6412 RepID=T1FEL7_HELRO|nr:hypothetical protein HELRODRAFT_179358 [Helobdella robusta]ESN95581.1 hypothetical protein HELRODRAFT_179358 [Helobdella robusta]
MLPIAQVSYTIWLWSFIHIIGRVSAQQPGFSSPSYFFRLFQDAPVNTFVGQITLCQSMASSLLPSSNLSSSFSSSSFSSSFSSSSPFSCIKSQSSYFLLNENQLDFSIDRSTGVITTKNTKSTSTPLHFRYNVTTVATSSGTSYVTTVAIEISRYNKFAPRFASGDVYRLGLFFNRSISANYALSKNFNEPNSNYKNTKDFNNLNNNIFNKNADKNSHNNSSTTNKLNENVDASNNYLIITELYAADDDSRDGFDDDQYNNFIQFEIVNITILNKNNNTNNNIINSYNNIPQQTIQQAINRLISIHQQNGTILTNQLNELLYYIYPNLTFAIWVRAFNPDCSPVQATNISVVVDVVDISGLFCCMSLFRNNFNGRAKSHNAGFLEGIFTDFWNIAINK